ncbi:MAG: hypothetical protein VW948_02705 [Burkholderiaceae bacterium]
MLFPTQRRPGQQPATNLQCNAQQSIAKHSREQQCIAVQREAWHRTAMQRSDFSTRWLARASMPALTQGERNEPGRDWF